MLTTIYNKIRKLYEKSPQKDVVATNVDKESKKDSIECRLAKLRQVNPNLRPLNFPRKR